MPLEIVRNDITKMNTDAIVNAANLTLLGGGGVDGAIHKAAGPELLEECRGLGGCAAGQAKITGAYRLPCRYVIHTVGPVWHGGNEGEKELLASCYRESLELAEANGCESVAFPLISSGAYGYPKDQALKVATDTIRDFLMGHDMTVYLVVFDRTAFGISSKLYANIRAYIDDTYIGPDYERRQRLRRMSNIREDLHYAATDEVPLEETMPDSEFAMLPEAAAPSPALSAGGYSEKELKKLLQTKDESFREMLLRKIDERHMTDAECYKKANVDRKLFNKIKNQKDYRPGKPTVVALAVALRLSLRETKEMLMKAGFSLAHNNEFDIIVEYFIRERVYDVFLINEALFTFDQKLLGSSSP